MSTRLPLDDFPPADPTRFIVTDQYGGRDDGVPESSFESMLDRFDPNDVEHCVIGVCRVEPIPGLERQTEWRLDVTATRHLHLERVVLEAEVIEDDDPHDEEEVVLVRARLRDQPREIVLDAMKMVARGGGARLLEALSWNAV